MKPFSFFLAALALNAEVFATPVPEPEADASPQWAGGAAFLASWGKNSRQWQWCAKDTKV